MMLSLLTGCGSGMGDGFDAAKDIHVISREDDLGTKGKHGAWTKSLLCSKINSG